MNTHMNNDRNAPISQKENLLYRTLLALALILLAAALRIAPHPWNFTPVGAMALFSGAVLKNRRLAFIFPLLVLFLGDIFIGFHILIPIVYTSFLLNIAIGLFWRRRLLRPALWRLCPGGALLSRVPGACAGRKLML